MNRLLQLGLTVALAATFVLAGCICEEEEVAAQPAASAPPPKPAPKPAPKVTCPPKPGVATATAILPSGQAAGGVVKMVRTAPDTVLVGQKFDYNITLTNLLKKPLANVVLKEKLSDNFTLDGASPEATRTGSVIQWAVGTLAPGATRTFTVRGAAKGAGPITPCADVTYDNPELCLGIKAVQPALQIAKTGPAEIIQCDPITYKIVVSNPGTGSACNVVITDKLPAGIKALDGRDTVTIKAGNLAPGASRTFSFQAKATKTGTFTNVANARADAGLAAASRPVSTKVTVPVLAVTKTGPALRYIGRTATYTITVTNNGDAPAKNTVVTDTVPANATLVGASKGGQVAGGKVVWALGTLEPKASKSVSVQLRMNQPGVIRNVASAEAYCARGQAAATTTVKGIPAILLECVDIADPIEIGAQETYVITVTNQGSAVGTNIVIACTLPDQETYVSAEAPTKATAKGKQVTFAPLASLAPKAKAVYKVHVKGKAAGDVRFKVSLTSDQMDSPATETESTHIYSDK